MRANTRVCAALAGAALMFAGTGCSGAGGPHVPIAGPSGGTSAAGSPTGSPTGSGTSPVGLPTSSGPGATPGGPGGTIGAGPGTPDPNPPGTSGPAPGTPGGGPARCAIGHLVLRLEPPSSAKFQEATSLVMTNSDAAACTLSGYPALQFLGPSGPMPTTQTSAGGPAQSVALGPGQPASALLIWNKYDSQGRTCSPSPTSIRVTVPGSSDTGSVAWLTGSPSASVCGGKLEVHPIVAGTDGAGGF